jgi:hypothetical protein
MEYFEDFKDEPGLSGLVLGSQMVLLEVETIILEMEDFELVLE